ncbi:homoserine kinase [Seinonella peptonophila]|uniref:Homoserine kinase n=1 Tax=Seinonella peptonophila TaxID=112248 RepID=A0A1M4TST1_9BACL|nr:homoserine kinase [Seinonella peptonophila]SHE47466.1 homoserine kinase [Seinonella peptonophila]
MKEFQPFRVVIPASSANLGPGFDSIGLALNRYLQLTFLPHEQLKIQVKGFGETLPIDENNLIIRVMKKAFDEHGQSLPTFHLSIENEIPLARGLGSSAAAIVGGLVAANHLLGNPWNQEQILHQATKWEDHPDNVGASLYGGVMIGSWDGHHVKFVQIEPPELDVVVAIPDATLFTKQARQVLPEFYRRNDAVLVSSRANLLTAALLTKRWELLSVAMEDYFHQPYRESLVPGLSEALMTASQEGALGVALSGAGPTILAFTQEKERLIAYFESLFSRLEVSAVVESLQTVAEGVKLQLTEVEECSTFGGKVLGV